MEEQKHGSKEAVSGLKKKAKCGKKKKVKELIDEGGQKEEELLNKNDDEEFLKSLCNTGRELN